MIRYQLGVILEYIFLSVKFYGALKQVPKFVNVFLQLIIDKNLDFCLLFSLVDFKPITLWIQTTPRGFKLYYKKLTVQFLFHQKEHCVYFLQASVTSMQHSRDLTTLKSLKHSSKLEHQCRVTICSPSPKSWDMSPIQ